MHVFHNLHDYEMKSGSVVCSCHQQTDINIYTSVKQPILYVIGDKQRGDLSQQSGDRVLMSALVATAVSSGFVPPIT